MLGEGEVSALTEGGEEEEVQAHPSSLAAAWASVLHTLVFAIRKFSGLSSVLKLVPTETESLHLQRRA